MNSLCIQILFNELINLLQIDVLTLILFVLNMISDEISCSTLEINLVFPRTLEYSTLSLHVLGFGAVIHFL
jgi:hypothetical protein